MVLTTEFFLAFARAAWGELTGVTLCRQMKEATRRTREILGLRHPLDRYPVPTVKR